MSWGKASRKKLSCFNSCIFAASGNKPLPGFLKLCHIKWSFRFEPRNIFSLVQFGKVQIIVFLPDKNFFRKKTAVAADKSK